MVLGGKHTRGREHRTEVTEATEGDLEPVGDGRLFVDSVGFRRVTHALGREHRTEVTEAYSNYQLGARVFANADQRDDDDGAYDVKQGQAGEQRSIAHRGGQRPNDQREG